MRGTELNREGIPSLLQRAGRRQQHDVEVARADRLHAVAGRLSRRGARARSAPDATAADDERRSVAAADNAARLVMMRAFVSARAARAASPSRRSRIQKKMTGVTISTWSSDDTMPPSTGVASGFITSAPTRVLHMIGSRPATTVETVITFGPQPQQRAFHDGVAQRRARQRAAELAPLPLDGFLEIDDHDDAGLHGGAEERDEADPHRDREVVAEQPQQVHAAGQRERHGEQHVRGLERRVIREVQQHEDDERARSA